MEKPPNQDPVLNQGHTPNQNPQIPLYIADGINSAIDDTINKVEVTMPTFTYQKISIEPNQAINLTYPDLGGCYTVTASAETSTGKKILIVIHQPFTDKVLSNLKELTNNEKLENISVIICAPEENTDLFNQIQNILNPNGPIPITKIIYDRKVPNPNNPGKKMPAKAILTIKIPNNQVPQINFNGSHHSITHHGGERGI